jgi:hypothetical protein
VILKSAELAVALCAALLALSSAGAFAFFALGHFSEGMPAQFASDIKDSAVQAATAGVFTQYPILKSLGIGELRLACMFGQNLGGLAGDADAARVLEICGYAKNSSSTAALVSALAENEFERANGTARIQSAVNSAISPLSLSNPALAVGVACSAASLLLFIVAFGLIGGIRMFLLALSISLFLFAIAAYLMMQDSAGIAKTQVESGMSSLNSTLPQEYYIVIRDSAVAVAEKYISSVLLQTSEALAAAGFGALVCWFASGRL